MGYVLGIDLGTTFSAAAVHRDGRAEVVSIGTHAPAVPSVVFVHPDGNMLTGEAAQRRAITEPTRVAREFKRRFGDPTPIMVGGRPHSAEELSAGLLRAMLGTVVALEGGPPDDMAICYPARWGSFKQNLLRQAVDLAGTFSGTDVVLVCEPVAAAVHHTASEQLDPGDVVAVYDLGGGTFDAAVLQRTDQGFELLGDPQGIERLGGMDFDAAVLEHVRQVVGRPFDDLDLDDPRAVAAAALLRDACTDAKEALSSEPETDIRVLLPGYNGVVRITRAEFEEMIRPPLVRTVETLERVLASAGVQPGKLAHVLLVGGSSRIPLVAELVSGALGQPVTTDSRPKLAVALGASIVAAARVRGVDAATAASTTSVIPVVELPRPISGRPREALPAAPPGPPPLPPRPAAPAIPAAPVAAAPPTAPTAAVAPVFPVAPPNPPSPPGPAAPPAPVPAGPPAGWRIGTPLTPVEPITQRRPEPPGPAPVRPPPAAAPPAGRQPDYVPRTGPKPRRRRNPVAAGVSLLLMVAIAVGVFAVVWKHRQDAGGDGPGGATLHSPPEVTVLVLNGSGLPGIANKGVEALKQPGYPASVGNAKAKVDATVVYVVEGFEADGAAVAGVLLEPAAPVRPLSEPFPPEVGDPGNAKVVVVLSKDSPLAKGKAR